jgi:hypothetical protein
LSLPSPRAIRFAPAVRLTGSFAAGRYHFKAEEQADLFVDPAVDECQRLVKFVAFIGLVNGRGLQFGTKCSSLIRCCSCHESSTRLGSAGPERTGLEVTVLRSPTRRPPVGSSIPKLAQSNEAMETNATGKILFYNFSPYLKRKPCHQPRPGKPQFVSRSGEIGSICHTEKLSIVCGGPCTRSHTLGALGPA